MLLLSEFVTYLIKFLALGVIAVAGVILGVKHKKNKIAKATEAASADEAAKDIEA